MIVDKMSFSTILKRIRVGKLLGLQIPWAENGRENATKDASFVIRLRKKVLFSRSTKYLQPDSVFV